MSTCDTIARWMCNEPGVFTSKEAAEKCTKNMNYRYVLALSYAVIAIFFAVICMIVVNNIAHIKGYTVWYWFIPFIALGIIAAGKLGYDRSLTIPLEEQEKDEREIQEYMSSGMDRQKSIETIQKIRGAECEAKQARDRSRYVRNRYGIGNNIGISFDIT